MQLAMPGSMPGRKTRLIVRFKRRTSSIRGLTDDVNVRRWNARIFLLVRKQADSRARDRRDPVDQPPVRTDHRLVVPPLEFYRSARELVRHDEDGVGVVPDVLVAGLLPAVLKEPV